jgi:hypothetical protein
MVDVIVDRGVVSLWGVFAMKRRRTQSVSLPRRPPVSRR